MIVYLRMQSPLTKEPLRSDTLFGALCWTLRTLYGNAALERLLHEFDEAIAAGSAPPFLVSSLFPYLRDGSGLLHFLPRPLWASAQEINSSESVEEYQLRKKRKKANWVSETLIARAQSEGLSVLEDGAQIQAQAGALVTLTEAQRLSVFSTLLRAVSITRNTLNRLDNSTSGEGGQLYQFPVIASQRAGEAHTGLYFLLRANEAWRMQISAAVAFLAEKGWGGETTIGYGHAELEMKDEALPVEQFTQGERLMTLSLLFPSEADKTHLKQQAEQSFARIEKRKGILDSAHLSLARPWKPTLFMLSEGATFPRDSERRNYGSLFCDETPREGLPFQPRINGLAYYLQLKGEQT
ncbi:MAG TPA: type III-A CRISPR-associated RAMP protein Csm4 [Blastocatellia bacterium]|nr:type III-A CRISPR-associated RAMP protein Csm4 [Blastocatellia bacterium]